MVANTSNPVLQINMLGGFSISCDGGQSVLTDQNNRSKKVLTLLEYLITFRNKEISQNELIDLLWPEDEITEPANTLKTLLHRVRSAVGEIGFANGKDVILCRRGAYAWNNSLNVVVDAEEFEKLCMDALTSPEEQKLPKMLSAIDLYKGDFLPKTATEPWVVPINTYYHSLYLKIVHAALEKLFERGDFDSIISICQRAVSIDPYDEPLHLSMIQALINSGSQQAALKHYHHVTDLFLKRFGINPSPELTALYKEIIKTNQSTELNLGIIRDTLRETEIQDGAFFCEYEFFKDIYRLQARSAIRTGQVVHIALITVLDGKGKTLTQKKINMVMERLQEIIAISLRHGDIFARFSVSQFLVMLPSASLENSERVLNRISKNFRQKYPHMNILLHYSSLPLEPESGALRSQ